MIAAAWSLGILLAVILPAAYGAYRMAYSRAGLNLGRKKPTSDPYAAYREWIDDLQEALRSTSGQAVSIRSRDGLTLWGNYYETRQGAPVVIMFHGYRSSAVNDCCGGFRLSRSLGLNLLLVDQRAHGRSEGRVITFGVRERFDALDWIHWVNESFGSDTPILLYGVSMGAATVMMTSDLELPENVRGIIADCGYHSPEGIIRKVCGDLHYPHRLAYPLVRLGAWIFGGFDPNEASAQSALRNARVPVLFIHGEEDLFVPCEMSRICHEACTAPKTLLTFPKAGHGMSFLVDFPRYEKAVTDFMQDVLP